MEIEQRVKVVEVVALDADPPVVLDTDTPVREVVRALREKRSGSALLTREGKLAGIFTERDVLLDVIGVEGALDRPVSAFMTPHPVSVTANDPIRKVVNLMRRGGFRTVPVVDAEGRVLSCVRHKDIVNFLVEHFAERVLNLPPDPEQVAETREGG
jgi:CBS domain-containing protein